MSNEFIIKSEKMVIEASVGGFDVLVEHSLLEDNGYHMFFTDYDGSLCAAAWFVSRQDMEEHTMALMDMVYESYNDKHGKHYEVPLFKVSNGTVVMELYGCIYRSVAEFPSREVLDTQQEAIYRTEKNNHSDTETSDEYKVIY